MKQSCALGLCLYFVLCCSVRATMVEVWNYTLGDTSVIEQIGAGGFVYDAQVPVGCSARMLVTKPSFYVITPYGGFGYVIPTNQDFVCLWLDGGGEGAELDMAYAWQYGVNDEYTLAVRGGVLSGGVPVYGQDNWLADRVYVFAGVNAGLPFAGLWFSIFMITRALRVRDFPGV